MTFYLTEIDYLTKLIILKYVNNNKYVNKNKIRESFRPSSSTKCLPEYKIFYFYFRFNIIYY